MSATLFDLRKLSDEYHELRSCRAVAEKYGCSSETIRRALIANEIPRNGWKVEKKDSKPRRVMPTDEEIAEAVKEHGTHKAAADALGISPTKVNATMRKIRPADSRKRTCQYCGAELAGRKAGAVFCSKRCKDNASKERRGIAPVIEHEKICTTCGGPFKTVCSRQIYCPDCRRGAGKAKCGAKADTKRTAEERNPGFIFLSKNGDRVLLRCKKCGAEVERNYSRVIKGTVRCDACAYEKKRKAEALRLINTLGRLIDVKTPKVCHTCNKAFYSPHPGAVYCSEPCRRKHRGRRGSMRGRCRKYGVPYRPGITLPQLYNRDGGVCQICGKKTDWMDNAWGANFGPLYPTIDHIVPLAKGGPHSWENVQLAHAICNSVKRDTIETAETA